MRKLRSPRKQRKEKDSGRERNWEKDTGTVRVSATRINTNVSRVSTLHQRPRLCDTIAEIDLSSGTVDPGIEQVALTVHVADTVRSPRKRGTVHPDGRGGRGERPYKFTGKSRLCALRVP